MRTRPVCLVAGCVTLLAALVATSSRAPSPVTETPRVPGERLVVAGVDLPAVAADHGLTWSRALPALEAAVVEGPAGALEALRADPRVRHASLDVRFEVTGDACCERPAFEVDDASFARARAEVAEAFGPLRGVAAREVLVAVLDTGVDAAHPDLRAALAGGRSFLPDEPAWDEDPAGHGTAMTSLIAATPADPVRGVEGVAPGVRVLPLKVADRRGLARLGDVAAALVYAVDRGASVVLLSLGTRQAAPLLDDALAYAEARDVLVVAAAGNRNVHVDLEPAADPRVLSVGCVDDAGALALGAALAPTTDLLAPGVSVLAALPRRAHAPVTGSSVSAARGRRRGGPRPRPGARLAPAAALRAALRAAPALPLFADHPDVARAFRAGPLDAAALARALRARATTSPSPTRASCRAPRPPRASRSWPRCASRTAAWPPAARSRSSSPSPAARRPASAWAPSARATRPSSARRSRPPAPARSASSSPIRRSPAPSSPRPARAATSGSPARRPAPPPAAPSTSRSSSRAAAPSPRPARSPCAWGTSRPSRPSARWPRARRRASP
ncbi:MAG: S8 family serine peptidase [Planctomycetes bacterium]|nr:S8 family serine peptidase [Planctomycetota bacterium]